MKITGICLLKPLLARLFLRSQDCYFPETRRCSFHNTGMPSNSSQNITTFDGRIDVRAIHSPSQIESFDFDEMKISELHILDGLHPDVITECWGRTPLHMAVTAKHETVVQSFINQVGKGFAGKCRNLFSNDASHQCWMRMHFISKVAVFSRSKLLLNR